MKILLLHNFGSELGDWNNRIKRQIELMNHVCYLKVISPRLTTSLNELPKIKELIDKECSLNKPDVIYAVGPIMGDLVSDKPNVVYDAGTFKSLNILLENQNFNYLDIEEKNSDELNKLLDNDRQNYIYRMEFRALKSAKSVIIWDNKEADLIEKIFEVGTVKRINMNFSKLVVPIPFEDKKERVLMVAAKWGRKNKNGKLAWQVVLNIKEDNNLTYEVIRVGNGSESMSNSFWNHDKLMEEMNNSRVVFCPYLCGGCGTIMEALSLSCNVVIGEWHQFTNLIDDELIVKRNRNKDFAVICVDYINKAMKQYYPPKQIIKEECIQLEKIMDVCKEVCKK